VLCDSIETSVGAGDGHRDHLFLDSSQRRRTSHQLSVVLEVLFQCWRIEGVNPNNGAHLPILISVTAIELFEEAFGFRIGD